MSSTFDFSKILSVQITDRFFLIGLVIFVLGLIFFLKYFIQSLSISLQRVLHPLPWYSESLSKKYLLALLFLVIAALGTGWMYIGSLMQYYQPTEKAEAVGTIEIRVVSENRFIAKFRSSFENFPRVIIEKELTGNQWAIAGAFLNYPGALHYIGLKDGHQILDFMSKDVRTLREPELEYMKKINEQPDTLWKALARVQKMTKSNIANFHISPLMIASSGNYELYAATSGYVVSKIGKKHKEKLNK